MGYSFGRPAASTSWPVGGGNVNVVAITECATGILFGNGNSVNLSVLSGNMTLSGTTTNTSATISSRGIDLVAGTSVNINVVSGSYLNITGSSANGSSARLNGTINISGSGNVSLAANSSTGYGIEMNSATVNVSGGANVTMQGNSTISEGIHLAGLTSNVSNGTLVLNGTTGATTATSGVNLSGTLNTTIGSAGSFKIYGTSNTAGSAYGVNIYTGATINLTTGGGGTLGVFGSAINTSAISITNATLNAFSGALTLNGTSSGNATTATGITVNGTVNSNVASGASVTLNGTTTTSGAGSGINLVTGSTLNQIAGGGGTLSLVGAANNTSAVYIDNNLALNVLSGTMLVDGTTFGNQSNATGVQIGGSLNATVATGSLLNITGRANTSGGSGIGLNFSASAAVNLLAGGGGTMNLQGIVNSGAYIGVFIPNAGTLSAQSGNMTVTGNSTSNAWAFYATNGGALTLNTAAGSNIDIVGNKTAGGNSAISFWRTINKVGLGNASITGISQGNVGIFNSGLTYNVTAGNLRVIGISDTTGINLANTINFYAAAGSTLSVEGTSTSTASTDAGIIFNTNNYTTSGGGTVTFSGNATNGMGINLNTGTLNVSGSTTVNITGNSTAGVGMRNAAFILDTQGGNVTVNGVGANVGWSAEGALTVNIATGNKVTITGNSTGSGIGANILSTVTQTSAGNLILAGTTATGTTGMNVGAVVTTATDANLSTVNGNLLLNSNIISNTGNVTLAAGKGSGVAASSIANGNVTGGDLIKGTATSITAGTGKTVILYSGNANTSNLSGLVTNGGTSQY